jgi:hypothetical protein
MAASDDTIDALYRGPLEEFTSARNELAKSLRSEGDAAAAAEVRSLRKPSRAAWLVNQLAVRRQKEVGELLEVGEELRSAQEEMLAGSTDRDRLRDLGRREQQSIDSLLGSAEAIGCEHGVGEQILTRVRETLRAAAGDPEVAAAIRRGRLTREQRAAGIGLLGATSPAAPAKGKKGEKGKKGKDREAAERRARQERAKRRKEAERRLGAAEKKLERERARLERARETVEDAERKLHDAELGASTARRELKEL